MKISLKLTAFMVLLSLFSAGTVGVTLLIRARSSISSLAHDKAVTTTHDYAGEIRNFFSSYWFTAETLASIMESYENISEYNRRPFINAIVKAEVEKHKDIVGIWVIWEPDVLEGNDLLFIDAPGTTEEGRFSPYWYRDGNRIQMYALPEDEFNDPEAGDYYHIPRAAGRTMILDPYQDDVGGKTLLNTTIASPIISRDGKNTVLGVIGIDINVDTIQELSEEHMPFGSGLTAVYSGDGTIVAHFDSSRIGEPMESTEEDIAGSYLHDLIDSVTNAEMFSFNNYITSEKARFTVYIAPIEIGQYGDAWSYLIAVPVKTVMAAVNEMLFIVIVITIITLALVVFTAMMLSRSLSMPIIRVTETLKDISEGEGDLTRNIDIHSKDEIGSLAHFFNLTIDKIKNLVINIKNESAVLTGISGDLTKNMNETAAAMNQITDNIQSIRERILYQSSSVTETHATMDQVTVNINKLNSHVEDQSSNISIASAAIEEMVANIQSVAKTLVNNAANVHNLKNASDAGRSGLENVSTDIKEISQESEGLMEINSVMQNIASQTNLLSMNAAIEAAHAGEAGRGFAVVADEIRKLAESSSIQSKTISTVLKKIKESIDKITLSTENVLTKFQAIDSSVNIVAEQEDLIRNAMEEQGEGSKQLLIGISRVNELTQKVKDDSGKMLEGAKEVISESANLEKTTQEITLGVNDMASGANHVNSAVNQVNEISGKNREGIDMLIKEISRFKVA